MALLVTGCAPVIASSTPLSACTPEEGHINPYYNLTPGAAEMIYDLPQTPSPAASILTRQTLQHDALHLLVGQVRQWSDYVDLLVQGNIIVRITVTYISPELIESVVLNDILDREIIVADFVQTVQDVQDGIAERDELLFLVTITASEYQDRLLPNDALVIDIPLGEMKLTNSENLSVTPRHSDGFLAHQINLRHEPEHGYLTYPIAVESGLNCQEVINPRSNTSISLYVPHVYINEMDFGQRTWSMDYRALIEVGSLSSTPSFELPPPGEETKYTPSPDAPWVVNGVPRADTAYWDGYWEQMARFIWYHLTDTQRH